MARSRKSSKSAARVKADKSSVSQQAAQCVADKPGKPAGKSLASLIAEFKALPKPFTTWQTRTADDFRFIVDAMFNDPPMVKRDGMNNRIQRAIDFLSPGMSAEDFCRIMEGIIGKVWDEPGESRLVPGEDGKPKLTFENKREWVDRLVYAERQAKCWEMPPGAVQPMASVGMAAVPWDGSDCIANIIVGMTEGACVLRNSYGQEYAREWHEIYLVNPRPDLSDTPQGRFADPRLSAAAIILPMLEQCDNWQAEANTVDGEWPAYVRLYDQLAEVYRELHRLAAIGETAKFDIAAGGLRIVESPSGNPAVTVERAILNKTRELCGMLDRMAEVSTDTDHWNKCGNMAGDLASEIGSNVSDLEDIAHEKRGREFVNVFTAGKKAGVSQ